MFASMNRAAVARVIRVVSTNRTASLSPLAVSSTMSRRFVNVTNVNLEKHITKVPTMGDSITEGTIVEWMAQVGQRVEEEDVVALIETDKVTVDIKATKAGVIIKQFGAVDDEVEVGADLYEVDSEAEATVGAAEMVEPAQTTGSVQVQEPTPTESAAPDTLTTATPRVPSIRFLGKEGWQRALTAEAEFVIPATYGRLDFLEEEIEALLSGGANIAPEIKEYSEGAVFCA